MGDPRDGFTANEDGTIRGSDKDKMTIKSRDLGGGRYEVCGVIFYAKSHIKAIRKWLRTKKPNGKE